LIPVYVLTTASTFLASLVTLAAAALRPYLWARKHGVSPAESMRIHGEPTARTQFWSKPHIAQFLASSSASALAPEPQSPDEIVNAIAAAVQDLPGPQRGTASEATEAARQLASAIDSLDGEIAILARDADPTELGRLENRLTALGPESAHDSPGQRDMRQLYASQIELLRRLSRQSQELSNRRARYVELLRTLWLQVAALRAQRAQDDMQLADVSSRIRAIVRSVEHEVAGAREAARVIAG
jgi:hypothetical protein